VDGQDYKESGKNVQTEKQGDRQTRDTDDDDFAALLAACVQDDQGGEGGELTANELDIISSYGVERLEQAYDRLTHAASDTVIPDDEQSRTEMFEQLQQNRVKGRVIIIPDVPEQVERITECQERLPEFAKVLEEFDQDTLLTLVENPKWLLNESKERTAQRKCLGEFETFSKTLEGKCIATPSDCDRIMFRSNKTHFRLKEEYVIRPIGCSTLYRVLFYYIDECIFSCLVFAQPDSIYTGCFFIQSVASLARQ